jgi:hypothetical protein
MKNYGFIQSKFNLKNDLIELLKDNMDSLAIHWNILSGNYNAIDMLKENINSLAIDWSYLSNNPNIFIDEPLPKII